MSLWRSSWSLSPTDRLQDVEEAEGSLPRNETAYFSFSRSRRASRLHSPLEVRKGMLTYP